MSLINILVLAFAATALVLALFALTLGLRRTRASRMVSHEELSQEVSLADYRIMSKLLDGEDYRYLKRQPGFTPELGRRFQRERRKTFRLYLDRLSRDFEALEYAAQRVALNSGQDRKDLATLMIRQRVRFTVGMGILQIQLGMHVLGLGKVNVEQIFLPVELVGTRLARTETAL